jgi:hypothetical protein
VPNDSSRRGNSRSPSPVANRQQSRSPRPYRRKQGKQDQLERPPLQHSSSHSSTPALPLASSESPRVRTPQKSRCDYSESGTEADDELTRRLPAPRALKRVSSEDEVWNHDGKGHRWTRRLVPGKPKSAKKLGAAFLRRGIEVGLAVVLVAVVLLGQERRALKEVLFRKKGAPDRIGRVYH